ncbi:MAG: ATP-binding protein [Candidatus Heimdallarchaeota archaeon]
MSLSALLTQPEGKRLEFKEKVPESLTLAKTACAFANGGGGTIIIGVRDKGRAIVGLEEGEIPVLEEKVANILHTTVEPMVASYITVHNLEEMLILKVDIFPGSMKPYHLKGSDEVEGTYIRVGSTNRKVDMETIEELRRQRMNICFDEVAVHEAREEELDHENIKYYLRKRLEVRDIPEAEITSDFLVKIRTLKKIDDHAYPTVGGILLFSKDPTKYLSNAVVKCARFKGQEMDDFLDQKEVVGSLFKQVEEVIAFFRRNVRRGAKIEGVYRKEEYEYPLGAVREAVVNAICHRDYSRRGADIKFAIFDDRLEVTSPGPLPPQISLRDLDTGVSELRNRVISRIFNEIGLIEGWGTGIRRIKQLLEKRGLKPPEFQEQANFFKVIFFSEPIISDLDEDEKIILKYIKNHERAQTKELENETGKSASTTKRKIKRLVNKGLLKWKGKSQKDPTGYYVLTKHELV